MILDLLAVSVKYAHIKISKYKYAIARNPVLPIFKKVHSIDLKSSGIIG